MLCSLSEQDLVFEDVAIILEKVDVPYIAVPYAEVNWLVSFGIFYAFNHCHCLRFSPIPQRYWSVHVISYHKFGVEGRFGNAVEESSNPFRPAYSAGLTWEYEFFSVWEKLDVVGRRCDEIDVDWLLDANVVLYDGIGDRNDIGRDGMGWYCDRRRLMAFECDWFIFGEIEERDFVVGAGQEHIGVELVDIDHVCVLVWVKFVRVLVCFLLLVVSVLQDEAIGITAQESVIEWFDFVENGRSVADAKAFWVKDFCWFWHVEIGWRLFVLHYYIIEYDNNKDSQSG